MSGMTTSLSVQEMHAPANICFGCGVANPEGLQLRSRFEGERLVAIWQPQPRHQAFAGMLNGGIIGTLLDCNCCWTAALHLMQLQGLDAPPCTVTAEYTVRMHQPTPVSGPLRIESWVLESGNRSVKTAGSIAAQGIVTATCEGVFVAVKEGHPAFHRW
jgi:acyl-coenzyme A thioesterase PaaI-like protein